MEYNSKPWLKSYKLGPYKLEESLAPYPEVSVYRALDDAAKKYPNQTAIVCQEREIKYKDLKDQADRLANGLIRMGIKKGDKVGIFLPNCSEAIISDWAILKIGAAVVPISTLRTDDGIVHEAGSAKAQAMICKEEDFERLWNLKARCDFETLMVVAKDGYDISDLSKDLPAGAVDFGKLITDTEPLIAKVEIDPKQDLCELAFTGGATGVPKGVMVTHFNRYSCIRQGFPWIFKPLLKGIAGKASILIPVPLFHSYGRYMVQSAAYLGLRVILIPDPRDIDQMVEQINRYRPMMLTAVPTQLVRIAQKKIGKMNIIPLSGAAPLPTDIADAIKKEFGSPVSEGYGLTETSPLTHFNISSFSKITGFILKEKHGIGIPAPDTECRLVDPISGKDVPFGEPGEIMVKGPQIMKGYWPGNGAGLTEDGWLSTGDIAFMDEDGYFHMTDRTKDMVNISGNKVYTTQVDEVLYNHPAVLMAASFGVPDLNNPGSERVMAVIQLKPQYEEHATIEEFQDFCSKHLTSYARPKYIEFRNKIPLTVTEKIFKKKLRDEAIEKMKLGKYSARHFL